MNKSILLKILLILLFVFNIFNCQKKEILLGYQNDEIIQNIGIGLLQIINPNKNITLYSDNTLSKIKIVNPKIGTNFTPILNKPDYNILFFVCVEKKSKFYKIIISKDNYAYIKPSDNFIFYNWGNFLKEQVVSIESKDLNNNPLRYSINGKTLSIKNLKSDDEVEIQEVKGEWIYIENITRNKKYWLQWKNKSKLLVYLNLLV